MIANGGYVRILLVAVTAALWGFETRMLVGAQDFSAPIQVPVSGSKWYGNDGSWSPVSIRVGTPSQWIDVLVSTASSETWVIGPGGCRLGALGGYTCTDRGEVFNYSISSTWNYTGQYDLGLRPELRRNQQDYINTVQDFGFGEYGMDVIRFGDEVVVEKGVVAVINDTSYLLGFLGLGITSSNIEGVDNPSLLSHLFQAGRIPSRSWGYTAGAFYRLKTVATDLILGGHNLARYHPHTTTFTLDDNNNPVVTLSTLTVSATGTAPWGPGPRTLLLNPILAQIDSTTPYIWLPPVVCTQFEQSLGLTWDNATNLYFLNETGTVYNSLLQLNLTFSFELADLPGGDRRVEIDVPYAAFDLDIGWPFTGSGDTGEAKRKYFPIKRADDESQYTLGRAFLQEAYLIVDYERRNFSVHQAVFEPGIDEIVAILPPGDSTNTPSTTTPATEGRLSKAAIIGIAVAGVVIVILVIVACALGRKWRKRRAVEKEERKEWEAFTGAAKDQEMPDVMPEMEGVGMSELPGMTAPAELEGNISVGGVKREASEVQG